ncbi:MAG: SRPBCC domain-containing protein [Alphaproteobacteria bacterium]|nr:SRPBCC domain-containing protein [Alphaproteobacteria bacterium]
MCYHITTEIHIRGTPENVWQALVDFPNYPNWNPFITRIEQIGDKQLAAVMKNGSSSMEFKPQILKFQKDVEFRWLGKLAGVSGLFTGEHYFQLQQTDEGTLLQHGEKFSGILAWILLPFKHKEIKANFILLNEALKRLVENKDV